MLRILIVEDEFLIALQSEQILTSAGHRVVGPVPSGAEAAALAMRQTLDLALVDLRLRAGECGSQVAADLFRRFGVRTLFASGSGREHGGTRHETGAVGCLAKPYDAAGLLAAIEIAARICAGGAPPAARPPSLELYPSCIQPTAGR